MVVVVLTFQVCKKSHNHYILQLQGREAFTRCLATEQSPTWDEHTENFLSTTRKSWYLTVAVGVTHRVRARSHYYIFHVSAPGLIAPIVRVACRYYRYMWIYRYRHPGSPAKEGFCCGGSVAELRANPIIDCVYSRVTPAAAAGITRPQWGINWFLYFKPRVCWGAEVVRVMAVLSECRAAVRLGPVQRVSTFPSRHQH